jgi:hypothetical protein
MQAIVAAQLTPDIRGVGLGAASRDFGFVLQQVVIFPELSYD